MKTTKMFKLFENDKEVAFGTIDVIASEMGWSNSKTMGIINFCKSDLEQKGKYKVVEISEEEYNDMEFEYDVPEKRSREYMHEKCKVCGEDASWEYVEKHKSNLDKAKFETCKFFLCDNCSYQLRKWIRNYIVKYEDNTNI